MAHARSAPHTLAPVLTNLSSEPIKALLGMRAALGHLLLDLEYEIDRRQTHQMAKVPEVERAVLLDEAIALLGISKDYAYRHWKKLGGTDVDGHIKFPPLSSATCAVAVRPHDPLDGSVLLCFHTYGGR
jgi:hypothetical protein